MNAPVTPEHDHFADDARRYALVARIATGGMGEVWRGRDQVLGRPVAVKLLKAEFADDALFRRRFETEAQHAASLHHPGIAGVFDFGEASPRDGSSTPRPYLVMELVEGQPLSDLLRPSAPMDPDVTRDLMAQTADALGAAHRAGIVHRDVKPGNLIVTPDRRIKVTDFGIARAAEGLALTQTGQVMGTPAYISPEQAEGGTATAASDVYSLGVVAFECLVGRRPFVADSAVATALAHLRQPVPEIPDHVPGPLAAVVTRALAKQPSERYADGAAFAVALRDPESAVGPASTTAQAPTQVMGAAAAPAPTQVLPAAAPVAQTTTTRESAPPPANGGARRTNWLPWALLAAVVVAGALIIWQLSSADDADDARDPVTTPSQSNRTQTEPPAETATETPTEPPAESDIEVDEADYVGSDLKDAEARLRELGLEVDKEKLDNPGDQVEDTVAGVDPTGQLVEGDTVTLTYWGKSTGKPEDDEKGPKSAPAPTGAPLAATYAAATPPSLHHTSERRP
ncbi:protein kinase domain-containing protein [Nocardioides sp.]|uniref:protein kinase domain-containing protein n=1 Tax=Nocardioides sp. TaxID=35761 RepID=UPI002B7A6A25|nr:protein kinase [Nocardioides sp.]HXH80956.1 protein kinase [Nocardioides sp.]